MPSVTLIDNYDSFTFNLVHYFGALGAKVKVLRNDQSSVEEIIGEEPDCIVLSPGPCTPHEAGVCLDLIRAASAKIPIFGVCLGHQAIGEVFGGEVVRAPSPVHGKIAEIHHEGETVFHGLPSPVQGDPLSFAGRAPRHACPPNWRSPPRPADGLIMGLSHITHPTHGVQFHPESIASEHGHALLRNFLDLAKSWNAAKAPFRAAGLNAMESFKPFLAKIATGAALTRAEARSGFRLPVVRRDRPRPRRAPS